MSEYDFVDPDLPEKREVRQMMEEKAEEGTLFGRDNSEGERLTDFDRERLQESGHLPVDEKMGFESPEPEEVLEENSTAEELAETDIEEYPEVENRKVVMEGENEPLGKLCADPEQMEEVEYGPPKGYSDKPAGSYRQRGFVSRCLSWLGSLF